MEYLGSKTITTCAKQYITAQTKINDVSQKAASLNGTGLNTCVSYRASFGERPKWSGFHYASWRRGRPRRRWCDELKARMRSWPVAVLNRDE